MLRRLQTIWILAMGMVFVVTGTMLAASGTPTPEQSPAIPAKVLRVEGKTNTFHVRDFDGVAVEVTLPAGLPADGRSWQLSRPNMERTAAPGEETMPVHVVSVEQAAQRLRVRTAAKEVVVLEVPAIYLANLRVGDPLILIR